ncbi:MAG: 4Fe-4S dicluster domain-containing protein [Bacteroidales bacterium]|nr:4Fe-4S dicluster domain-containing protein [Bacteroidales bacterium]
MNNYHSISRQEWEKALSHLINNYHIYAPVPWGETQDYERIDDDSISDIIYNRPKPATPLKTFFLPIRENVVNTEKSDKKRIIMGIPSCDLSGINIFDEMYLDDAFVDPTYKKKREDSILIGTDCHTTQENCHCTTYGIKPYPMKNHDLTLSLSGDTIYLQTHSAKGETLIEEIEKITTLQDPTENEIQEIVDTREKVEEELNTKNRDLPNYRVTGDLINSSEDEIWKKYSETCVSCGACATICPTCTCFLLLEKPGFEKVRHLDACQYPGFEKVAAGEDPLEELYKRFRNRYMCKYVWKPKKFESIACTGCGRCIEACIGNINKNELFLELANK